LQYFVGKSCSSYKNILQYFVGTSCSDLLEDASTLHWSILQCFIWTP
jgi:hypothetical protein